MAVNIGPRIGIEGEAEYRKQINQIINSSKTLATQMKALTTSFDSNKKSLAENAKQHKLLQEQIKNGEQKLSALNSMLEKSKTKFGENATQTQKWQQAVSNAEAELNTLKNQLNSLPSSLDLVASKFESMGNKLQSIGSGMTSLGSKMTSTVTTGVAGAFGASIKSAIDWESAFTGVMKTVDETATTTYADLEQSIMKLSTETASSKSEIAAVAEAAGQLGVSADDIEGFTKTMIMLGDTTNLSADEAATALARFTNITGSGNSSVDRLGSTIVALGNNFATTESEIVEMSTRLASAGTIAGLSETDILGLAAAMSSVGIQAEAGGTAMSQTLKTMASAVADFKDGNVDDLEVIAKVSNSSAKDFADAWEKDPVKAMQAFIGGLAQVNDEGGNVFSTLEEMGMSGIRQTNMLQSLALASETLGSAVDTASSAYKSNTALTDEAEKRYGTFAAKISQLKEQITNLAVTFGNDLLPYVQKAIDFIGGLVEKFSGLDEEQRGQVIKIAAIAAAIGPLLMTGGKLLTGIGKLMSFAPQLATALQGVSGVFGGVGASAGAALAPIAAVAAAIGVLVAAFMNLWNNNEQFKSNMTGTWNSIKESFSGFIAQIQERLPKIQEAFNNVVEAVKPIWEGFCAILAPIFEGAFQNIALVLQTMFDFIISIIDMLTGILTGDKELFLQGLTEFLTTIQTFVTTYLNLLWTTIVNVINVILGFFGTSLTQIKTKIVTTFTMIVVAVKTKMTEFKDFIIEKFNEVCDFIKELPSKFKSWGEEMIENLIEGVKSKISGVTGVFGDLAGGIASLFHFSEPDKGPLSDFNSWMPDMMKQMADQIEKGRYQVQVAAGHVAADLAAPIMNSQTVTLNNSFTFNGGYTESNGREIARQINRQLGALYI